MYCINLTCTLPKTLKTPQLQLNNFSNRFQNCADYVLSHLNRGIGDQFSRGFDQLTLILYGNGCDSDKRNLRYSSSPSTSSFASRFALRRSASDETSSGLDNNNFLDQLVEKLQNAKSFTNVLLLKGGLLVFVYFWAKHRNSSFQTAMCTVAGENSGLHVIFPSYSPK